ncbi:MAG: VCBS repeat-containing protein [Flavobacteriaceae bacterium]|nr:VCBS repeat-containing protein [Flavobacteriaceae bacterium]
MKKLVVLIVLLSMSCAKETISEMPLFVLKDSSIGISFENNLTYTEAFNPYTYRNFYNGAGVSMGDINNDGLTDIYFTGNMVDNKLFLNEGNWKFKDITVEAGVACPNIWSTGATFVDINGDGLLDLYVCKSGMPGGKNRHNELFINNGDLTFSESSKEYGLDIEGLSVQAAFFDYDKDGDLDAYILNNSVRSIGSFALIEDQRIIPDITGSGNKFLRNDGGKFIDITKESGIYSSKIGFGLGITLGDYNNDSWTDIFISNDFFEKDYLYLNDKQGGFTEQMESYFESISMGSMGADYADLNNDLLPDLIVTEMLPQSLERQKTKTVFETWDKQQLAKEKGYYDQFSRNTLQRNLGNNQFLELGRQSGVAATEWSWGALMFDADNDGLRDIYISNGIYKDLLDQDFLSYEANDETIKSRVSKKEKNIIKKLIDKMPSKAISNSAYKNLGNFQFKDASLNWGLNEPSFSNGSAYGDLDNDGDLDLVVNNINMPSFVYENTTDTLTNRSVALKFAQSDLNRNAIGAKAIIKYNNQSAYSDNFVSRGFQSSVPPEIHFGVGSEKEIDSLLIEWPDGSRFVLTNLKTNTTHLIEHPDNLNENKVDFYNYITQSSNFEEIDLPVNFAHKENKYIDFNNERLLTQMHSNEGPAFDSKDINKDGIADLFFGGAKNQSGKLFISQGNTYKEITAPFETDASSEDTDALFFDADNDGDQDLYVCHGGKAFSPYSAALHDSFYINENGEFTKSKDALKFTELISSSVVSASDYDKDGDLDLFVGERFKTNTYGLPGSGYLLQNNGTGLFTIVENKALKDIGMITDASWVDIDNDGWQDLVVLGEWMSIRIFLNKNSELIETTDSFQLDNTSGLWTSLHIVDVDNDGDQDIIAGNIGLNNFYKSDMRMYINDFDGNGFREQIICQKNDGKYYPIVTKDELISQIPSLKKKLLYYKDYAKADIHSIFAEDLIRSSKILDLNILESVVFWNNNGNLDSQILPNEIQYAPVYTITSTDIDDDGNLDLFFGGNQFLVKPQFGKYDGSLGWTLFGPYNAENLKPEIVPLGIEGQIRNLEWIQNNNDNILIATINNEKPRFIKFKNN